METLPQITNPTVGDLSSRILKPLLVYFCKAYGEERLGSAITRTNLGPVVSLAYLQNENNWVSFAAGQRLIDVLDGDSGDPDFIRKAGLLTVSRETFGFAFTIYKALGNPKSCYGQVFKTLHLYNHVGEFHIIELTRNHLRFSYKSFIAEPNLRFSEYRMSQFASIPSIWGLPPADIKKMQCQVTEGASESIYELRWKTLHSYRIVAAGILAGASVAFLGQAFLGWMDGGLFYLLGGGLIGGLIGETIDLRRRLMDRDRLLQEQTDDILSSMKEAQARYDEAQSLNVSLEQKVEDRTAQLTEANERLQELDKLKNSFLANISHELRTPLVALSSTLQMILDRGLEDPGLQQELLGSSMAALEDMLENVNDLLLKTRSEKGMLEINWREIEIGGFVREAIKVFDSAARKKKISLIFTNRFQGPSKVYADRLKLKKIINNLVSNALKFTEEGEVEVIVEKQTDHCLITVKDTGTGVPEAELETIFEPFFQASNNANRDVRGTGIGLSLVKDLALLHHGDVMVESKLNQGSKFTVSLPLGDTHVDWERLNGSDVMDEQDKRVNLCVRSFDELDLRPFSLERPHYPKVLLVEDNPQIIQALAYVLMDHYNLLFARDGIEGVKKAREGRPDMIISDIMMPGKNGYELIRDIRNDPEIKGVPVILLTSKADRESRIRGFECGADEYLTKPFNNQEVLVRVKGLLERKRLEAEFYNEGKMISIGQLAAGVAHEVNNPLAYAMSAADTIGKLFEAVETGKITLDKGMQRIGEAIERVKDGTGRVAGITEALRVFIRQGAEGFRRSDIHQGIDATLKIIHANHKKRIRFLSQYELETKVECNANQLNQVFMNLLENAVHAVEGLKDAEISIHTFEQDGLAHILIKDNGPGIPKELIGRVFDLFFTTKKVGRGMGLGLQISKHIINEHGGSLTLQNRKGRGVLCSIQLPLNRGGDNAEHVEFTPRRFDGGLEKSYHLNS